MYPKRKGPAGTLRFGPFVSLTESPWTAEMGLDSQTVAPSGVTRFSAPRRAYSRLNRIARLRSSTAPWLTPIDGVIHWLEEAGLRVPHLGKRRHRYIRRDTLAGILRKRTTRPEWPFAEPLE